MDCAHAWKTRTCWGWMHALRHGMHSSGMRVLLDAHPRCASSVPGMRHALRHGMSSSERCALLGACSWHSSMCSFVHAPNCASGLHEPRKRPRARNMHALRHGRYSFGRRTLFSACFSMPRCVLLSACPLGVLSRVRSLKCRYLTLLFQLMLCFQVPIKIPPKFSKFYY